MDDDERQSLRAEGLDPDDPAVIAAIDLVRWELSLLIESPHSSSAAQNSAPHLRSNRRLKSDG
jgi:hypothetical protein